MKIVIETIPHEKQRYKTCGDWQFHHPNRLLVFVSDLGDWKMEACLAIHELSEALVCKWLDISQDVVDKFDMEYEGDGEPGDEPNCPYRTPHRVASAVEYIVALALDVDWKDYEYRLNEL